MRLQRAIKLPFGLHLRPVTEIVRALGPSRSSVTVQYEEKSVDARDLTGLLSLAAPQKAEIALIVEGEDAESTMHELLKLLTNTEAQA